MVLNDVELLYIISIYINIDAIANFLFLGGRGPPNFADLISF